MCGWGGGGGGGSGGSRTSIREDPYTKKCARSV